MQEQDLARVDGERRAAGPTGSTAPDNQVFPTGMATRFIPKRACEGAATRVRGEMQECERCNVCVAHDLVDHPFFGFASSCALKTQASPLAVDAVDPQAASQQSLSTRVSNSSVLSADAAALIAEVEEELTECPRSDGGDGYLRKLLRRLLKLARTLQQERDWWKAEADFKSRVVSEIQGREWKQELEEGYGYLSRLFQHLAPQCDVLPTVAGVATQIDNYIAGLQQERDALKAEKAELLAACVDGLAWMSAFTFHAMEVHGVEIEGLGATVDKLHAAITKSEPLPAPPAEGTP